VRRHGSWLSVRVTNRPPQCRRLCGMRSNQHCLVVRSYRPAGSMPLSFCLLIVLSSYFSLAAAFDSILLEISAVSLGKALQDGQVAEIAFGRR
jgi:hypothetical protein